MRATRLNRSAVEAAVVRRACALDLDYRVENTECTWLRRDFTVSVWGSPEAIVEFAEWLEALREGAGQAAV